MDGKKLAALALGILMSLQSCYSNDFDDCTDSVFVTPMEISLVESLPHVPQKAFYKDVFLDAGVGLTSRKTLYAARYLNFTTEGVSFPRSNATDEEIALQNSIIAGDENDTNGRLLYPDGQPRYKLLFVNGGSSTTHGKSLSEAARQNMRQFVNQGGSYVGTCAGAFFASNGYDGKVDYPYYLSLWPSTMNHTGISNDTTGMFIEYESPLLDYYDFGGDNYVSEIRHNKGGYPVYLPEETTIIAYYNYPQKKDIHLQPSIWSYKVCEQTGSVILTGSHPEIASSGERRDLTAAMMLYAMDGVGKTTIKGVLHNGEVRVMDKLTEDNDSLFTRIGDLQCHHFAMVIPEEARNISVEISSDTNCDLALMMCHNTFAYPEDADYVSTVNGSFQQLSFPTLEAGVWYVTVKCLTTVEVTETDYGQSYVDQAGVLNGVSYQIAASWDETHSDITLSNKQQTEYQSNQYKSIAYFGTDGKKFREQPSRQIYIHKGKKIKKQ